MRKLLEAIAAARALGVSDAEIFDHLPPVVRQLCSPEQAALGEEALRLGLAKLDEEHAAKTAEIEADRARIAELLRAHEGDPDGYLSALAEAGRRGERWAGEVAQALTCSPNDLEQARTRLEPLVRRLETDPAGAIAAIKAYDAERDRKMARLAAEMERRRADAEDRFHQLRGAAFVCLNALGHHARTSRQRKTLPPARRTAVRSRRPRRQAVGRRAPARAPTSSEGEPDPAGDPPHARQVGTPARGTVADAERLLRALLADERRVPTSQARAAATAAGASWRTVERARVALGVRNVREGFGPGARYILFLPATASAPAQPPRSREAPTRQADAAGGQCDDVSRVVSDVRGVHHETPVDPGESREKKVEDHRWAMGVLLWRADEFGIRRSVR